MVPIFMELSMLLNLSDLLANYNVASFNAVLTLCKHYCFDTWEHLRKGGVCFRVHMILSSYSLMSLFRKAHHHREQLPST